MGPTFDANSSKYKCCCNAVNVKTGAQIVAIVTALQLVLMIIDKVAFFSSGYLSYEIAIFIAWGFALACLINAFRTERAVYCAPYILVAILGFIIAVITIILSVIALCDNTSFARDFVLTMAGDEEKETDADVKQSATQLIGWTIMMEIVVESYFAWIVYKYHIFLRDQQLSRSFVATVQYSTRTAEPADSNS
uniref:Transmembrane protein n=1 Tax=Plectus sambesii TaxID=2011161 RepID=A0A914WGN9_9BILA